MKKPIQPRMALPVLIGILLAGAATVRGALTLGIIVFLGVTAIWLIIRSRYEADPLPVASRHREKREAMLVQLVAAGMLYLPAVAIATPFLDFAAYRTPLWLTGLGGALGGVGIWLFWRAHEDLGKNWSPVLELRTSHGLVTGGVYRHIRHPMYSALFLLTAAQAALLGNALAGPAGLIAFGLLYRDRVAPEEKMMAERFGTAWDQYAGRTGRLFPALMRRTADSPR